MRVRLELDGESFEVEVRRTPDGLVLACDGEELPATLHPIPAGAEVEVGANRHRVRFPREGAVEVDGRSALLEVVGFQPGGDEALAGAGGRLAVRAQMPGRVVKVHVAPGAMVEKGAPLLVLEAMKMQNELLSPATGKVSEVQTRPGDVVEFGRVLLHLEPGQKS